MHDAQSVINLQPCGTAMWRRCRGLPGVPSLVEPQADISQFIGSSLQCALTEAQGSAAGIASQALHKQRRPASTDSPHNHATVLQQTAFETRLNASSWVLRAFHDRGSTPRWGQIRSCQTTSPSAELDPSGAANHPKELSVAADGAFLRSDAAEDVSSTVYPASDMSTASSEAQRRPAGSNDIFEIPAAQAPAETRPLSALEAAQSLSSMQQQKFSRQPPKHKRPSRNSNVLSEGAPTAPGGEITSLAGLEQNANLRAPGEEIASLEQGVEDPGSMNNDEWDDYISIVRARREAAAAVDPNFTGEGGVPLDYMEARILRGGKAVRRMQSWKEMADWLREYRNHWFLKATEISRMWTHMVQLHMGPGVVSKFDHRKVIYPDAPFYSQGGREFLRSLTRITRKRLQLTLRLVPIKTEDYWENCRVRAPDAGRMLWAMGKLQWQSEKLLRLLEAAAVSDIDCEWNRPRYMTTALWGSAWSAPGVPLQRLCNALQKRPQEFWDRGTNAQNVCNMAWAMSMMRFQPTQKFSNFFQSTLQHIIHSQPRTIHPQNIGDMVQALAVMRRHPSQVLLYTADKWMHVNVHKLLPSHIMAYMNGLGLMRRLTPEQYQYYGESLEAVMSRASERDADVFAQRMYVLHHLVAPRPVGELPSEAEEGLDTWEHASEHAADYKLMYFRGGEELPEASEFLKSMEARGAKIVREMLLSSSKLIEQDQSTAAVRALLASIGYNTSIAPLEAAESVPENGQNDGPEPEAPHTLSPLLPELFVRARRGPQQPQIEHRMDSSHTDDQESLHRDPSAADRASEGTWGPADASEALLQEGRGPYVALQLIRENDCFCNAKSLDFDAVVGETALVRTILTERGTPVTEVFVEHLLSLPSVEEMQDVLRNKLQPLLHPGPAAAAPALEDVLLHGPGIEEEAEEEIPLVETSPNTQNSQNPPVEHSAESTSSTITQEGVTTLESDRSTRMDDPPLDTHSTLSQPPSYSEATEEAPFSLREQQQASSVELEASFSESFHLEVPGSGMHAAHAHVPDGPHQAQDQVESDGPEQSDSLPGGVQFEKNAQNANDHVLGDAQKDGKMNERSQAATATGLLHSAKTLNTDTVSGNVLLRKRPGMLAEARSKIVRNAGDADNTCTEARDSDMQ